MSINHLRSSTFFNDLNDPIKDLKDPVEPFIRKPHRRFSAPSTRS